VSLSEGAVLDPEAVLTACLADLEANAPAEDVSARLRAIDAQTAAPPALRARFLRARAIATRRLGFPNEALGDLYEAARLLDGDDDRRERSDIFRTIALVQGWSGDGREAALALLRAVADAAVPNDRQAIALALAEAGRLAMEIRRPHDAQALLACALDVGGPDLSDRERRRAAVNLLQALVASGRLDAARAALDDILPMLAAASVRLRFLVEIERVRLARAAADFKDAHAALARAAALLPDNPEAFEHIEYAEAEAELALAENDASRAADLMDKVVTRYATDDLAGREVGARLLQARVFEALERPDDAERTLAAALRRARARGLRSHADEVRSAIASRGGAEGAWIPGETSAAPIEAELTRRFVRRKTLGTGGFGSVVRAYDLELGTEVALKRSTLENIFDTAQRGRLLEAARTEVAAASRIEHPGVARIYGMLVEGDREALLIEEFVEGDTLRAALGKFDVPRGLDLLARLAYALAAVHAAGVVHRDFKPDNVILRPNGAPVLVDFGIALTAGARDRKGKGGTPFYVAPEQAAGRETDARADLYALGVVAHELLLKKRPEALAASNWRAWLMSGNASRRRELTGAGLPPDVADLVARLLAPHPRFRPRTASEAGASFAAAATEAQQMRPS
jgi:tetratricopeptide (TPR) repeat protein